MWGTGMKVKDEQFAPGSLLGIESLPADAILDYLRLARRMERMRARFHPAARQARGAAVL